MYKKEKSNLLYEIIYLLLKGLKHLFKINFFKITAPILITGAVLIFIFIYFDFHILLLKKALPTISNKGLISLSRHPLKNQFFLFYGFFLFLFLTVLGKYNPQEKLNEWFKKIGLKNSNGETPLLVKKNKLSSERINYILNCNGLSVEEFKDKKSRIESVFKKRIESIEGRGLGFVKITFNKKAFPKKVCYKNISKEKDLPKESFYIGRSNKGILTQKIEDLPYMLIAGTTGSGKSVFFKQTLFSLLKSSPHIQMYLIDLKGGLEFRDFSMLPNVKVVKTIKDAVSLLTLVKQEMEERFSYLEKCKQNKIRPLIDKKDRIISSY